jgi:hypothetical protein
MRRACDLVPGIAFGHMITLQQNHALPTRAKAINFDDGSAKNQYNAMLIFCAREDGRSGTQF